MELSTEHAMKPRFHSLQGAKAWIEKYNERLKEKGLDVRMAVENALIPLASIAILGIVEGYYGPDKFLVGKDKDKPEGEQGGFNVLPAIGLLGYVGSMWAGKWGHEIREASNGVFFYWSVDKFRTIGQKWKQKSDDTAAPGGGASHYYGPWSPRMGATQSPPAMASHHGVYHPEEAQAFAQAARYGV